MERLNFTASSPHENINVISKHTGYSPAEGTRPNVSLHENAFTVSAERMYQLAQYHAYLASMYADGFRRMTQQHGVSFNVPQLTTVFPGRGYPSGVQQEAHVPVDREEDTPQPLPGLHEVSQPTFMFRRGYPSSLQQNAHQPADGAKDTPQPLDLSTKKRKLDALSTMLCSTLEEDGVDQPLKLTKDEEKVSEPFSSEC